MFNITPVIPNPIKQKNDSNSKESQIEKQAKEDKKEQVIAPQVKQHYQQYLQLYKENKILQNQIKLINESKQELDIKLQQIKNKEKIVNQSDNMNHKRKRPRRTANEIQRQFECPASCGKNYGSQGSLAQHIKIKHKEDYEKGIYDHHIYSKIALKEQK